MQFPCVIEGDAQKADEAELKDALRHVGAVHLKGSNATAERFAEIVGEVCGASYDYRGPFLVQHRGLIGQFGNVMVFTSTEFNCNIDLPMHNEAAYAPVSPEYICFMGVRAAEVGGLTPIASGRQVLENLSARARAQLEDGLCYVRNLSSNNSQQHDDGMQQTGGETTWQAAFGTTSRDEVEATCKAVSAAAEWRDDDHLSIVTRTPLSMLHPSTGVEVMFSSMLLWNPDLYLQYMPDMVWTIRGPMPKSTVRYDELRYSATLANRSPIGKELLAEMLVAYKAASYPLMIGEGDIVLIDNIACTHARTAFQGERKLYAAMAGGFERPLLA